MRTLEEENRDLREKNSELAQKVQHWKMLAGQRDSEKLDLMKEINELRLKLSRLRSGGAAHARKLEVALQSASEEALSHLVQASNAVVRTVEMAKTHMRDRQELEALSPSWSRTSGTPTTDKVLKVPPTLMGGKHIQPVVSLNRHNNITSRPLPQPRSPNRQHTTMALPMHMLQDIIIPLTRIDMDMDIPNNNSDSEEDSTVGLGLDNSMDEAVEDPQHILSDDEGFGTPRRLDMVAEDLEPEDSETPTRRPSADPLEGPSWLLDPSNRTQRSRARFPLEPDSTTQAEGSAPPPAAAPSGRAEEGSPPAPLFSPTRRRRKRPSTPPPAASPAPPAPGTPRGPRASRSPRPAHRSTTTSRILKVLVPKMQLEGETAGASRAAVGAPEAEAGASPPKRAMRFDAPSPNGATVTGVIISETPVSRSTREVSTVVQENSRRRNNYDSSASTSDSERDSNASGRDSNASERDSNASGRDSNASDMNGSSLSLALSSRLLVNGRDSSPSEQDNNGSNRFSKAGVRASRPKKRDGHLNNGDSRDGHANGRDSRANERSSHASARDSHASARDSHASERDSHASARDSHASGRDSHASARDSHASARDSRASARDIHDSAGDSQARTRDRAGRAASHDSHDDSGSGDDSGGGRLRRTRKPVTYKEKPLNRKLRR